MPGDASAPARLSTEDDEAFDIVAYEITPENLDAWDKERPGLKAFLEARMRAGDEDAANGRLIPAEQVFAALRRRAAERFDSDPSE